MGIITGLRKLRSTGSAAEVGPHRLKTAATTHRSNHATRDERITLGLGPAPFRYAAHKAHLVSSTTLDCSYTASRTSNAPFSSASAHSRRSKLRAQSTTSKRRSE